jgi:hypothetical protein
VRTEVRSVKKLLSHAAMQSDCSKSIAHEITGKLGRSPVLQDGFNLSFLMKSLTTSDCVLPVCWQNSLSLSFSASSIRTVKYVLLIALLYLNMWYNNSMKARYQYRFYPTDQQRQSLTKLFGCVRVVWNDALRACKDSEDMPKNGDLQKAFITQAKQTKDREWLG